MKQTKRPGLGGIGMKAGPGGGNPGEKFIILTEEHYVDKYFQKDDKNGDTKDHVFINGLKLATIDNNETPNFIISDHLNSASIITNNNAVVVEENDYRPFGSLNYEDSSIENNYKFTDKELDVETNLQYFGARYMDNEIGKFISIDPVILNLQDRDKLKQVTGSDLQNILSDPQNLNGYVYGLNNPVKMVDADGNFVFLAPLIAYGIIYVTPIMISAIAGAGAYLATKEFSQGIGYMMEGQNNVAQQHFDNAIIAEASVAAGVTSLMSMEARYAKNNPNKGYVVPGQKINSSSQVPSGIRNQIPKSWGSGKQSKSGTGWVWTDPKNTNNEVRFMSGDPTIPHANSQNPYMVVTKNVNGQRTYFDAYGQSGIRRSAETHFDPSNFNINNYNY